MAVFTFVLYYTSWLLVIYFASHQNALFAAGVSVIAVTLQILLWSYFDSERCKQEIVLASYALVLGILAETFYLNVGATAFPTMGLASFIPPFWIIMLYPLPSMTLCGPFAWMVKRPVLTIVCGLLAPLCYIAGQKVKACLLPLGTLNSSLVIGPGWAFVLFYLSKKADK